MARYYVDTCVWRDYSEMRGSLGKQATKFFLKVIENKDTIVFSDHLVSELRLCGCEQAFLFFEALGVLEWVNICDSDWKEAKTVSSASRVSYAECLHAIIAKKNNCILITQNMKDFIHFKDFLVVLKPEQTLVP